MLPALVTENEVSHVFVHLNGVWISYANSFVTLQILMYLNKSNIQIPKCQFLLFPWQQDRNLECVSYYRIFRVTVFKLYQIFKETDLFEEMLQNNFQKCQKGVSNMSATKYIIFSEKILLNNRHKCQFQVQKYCVYWGGSFLPTNINNTNSGLWLYRQCMEGGFLFFIYKLFHCSWCSHLPSNRPPISHSERKFSWSHPSDRWDSLWGC